LQNIGNTKSRRSPSPDKDSNQIYSKCKTSDPTCATQFLKTVHMDIKLQTLGV